jgi:class 3 adenylate cyclase/DNA-binding CsgD family transcriptional regulator
MAGPQRDWPGKLILKGPMMLYLDPISTHEIAIPMRDRQVLEADQGSIFSDIEHFLTDVRESPPDEPERVLATVMVTEIVNAPETAARLGDDQWRVVLKMLERAFEGACRRYGARGETRMRADWLALFDSPTKACRCAQEIVESGRRLGLQLRAGLHTGEVLESERDVVGVAVHLAARVASHASSGTVLVSHTVKDLVSGSGLAFDLVGDQAFAGLPGAWQLYAVTGATGHREAGPAPVPPGRAPRLVVLSPREREVARLVALGLSNRQIADELFIAPATVERHVANMMTKLGHRSRAQIASWVTAQGIFRTAANYA